jgi:hypothetical protein
MDDALCEYSYARCQKCRQDALLKYKELHCQHMDGALYEYAYALHIVIMQTRRTVRISTKYTVRNPTRCTVRKLRKCALSDGQLKMQCSAWMPTRCTGRNSYLKVIYRCTFFWMFGMCTVRIASTVYFIVNHKHCEKITRVSLHIAHRSHCQNANQGKLFEGSIRCRVRMQTFLALLKN